ncbi:MAG: PEP-CTERM sorting domain-containing protein [Candidatus Omnitrophica bacterium]|nr:PEP-CTERM sorting domain-containing protein [Candidatus Omnitrophota bacterium]
MKKFGVGLCLVVLASLFAAPAGATLIGDEVFVSYTSPGDNKDLGPESVIVEAGDGDLVSFLVFSDNDFIRVNVEESSIIIAFEDFDITSGIFFGGPITVSIVDLDWVGVPGIITGVSFVNNGITSLATNPVSFTNNPTGSDVFVDLSGSDWENGDTLTINLETTHDIPEPTTMALLATGAAGLIAKRRRVV